MNIDKNMTDGVQQDRFDRRNAHARHEAWATEMDKLLFSAAPAPAVPAPAPNVAADLPRRPVPPYQDGGNATVAMRADAGRGIRERAPAPGAHDVAGPYADDANAADGVTDAAGMAATWRADTASMRTDQAVTSSAPSPSTTSVMAAATSGPASPATEIGSGGSSAADAVMGESVSPNAGTSSVMRVASMPPAGAMTSAANATSTTNTANATAPAAGLEPPAATASAITGTPATHAARSMASGRPGTPVPTYDAHPMSDMQEAADIDDAGDAGGATGRRGPAIVSSGEDYAERLLHLYQEDGQVRAWIRDAALQPQQARAVAQALALQLSAQGNRLAALTINGRPQDLQARGAPHAASGLFEQRLTDADGNPFPDQGDAQP